MRSSTVVLAVLPLAALAATGPPYNAKDWVLDFEDEFDTFNKSLWNPMNGTHGDEGEHYLPDNCAVKDGKLILTGLKQYAYGHNYTSCWVDTRNNWNARYGRFEVTARIPAGKGIWPAHWLMPGPDDVFCWPLGGEIDIMEAIGNPRQVHGALHWSVDVNWNPCGQGEKSAQNFSQVLPDDVPAFNETFTTFGVEWDETSMVYYWNTTSYVWVDDPGSKFVQKPFYFILNTAIGGDWPGFPDNTTHFPSIHEVDSVRHYSRAN